MKVEEDPEVLEKRRALASSKTPAELAQISSIADLPIPTALEKFIKKPKTDTDNTDKAGRYWWNETFFFFVADGVTKRTSQA